MFVFAALLKIALLTSDHIPASDKPEDQLLINALHEYEVEAQSVDWHSPNVVWSDFDAVLVYSTWDYYENPSEFVDLLRQIEDSGTKVYNSSSIVEWNADKKYLQDLETWGLKTIDTVYLSPGELENLETILIEKGWNECVIKPQFSASGYHTYRFNLSDVQNIKDKLKDFDEQYMVQPLAEEVISEGEWSFVFFEKEYVHCILKKPKEGEFKVQGGQKIPISPPDWMIKEVEHILETIDLPSLKTRVDVIQRDGEIRIMEIEMIEPVLYLKYSDESAKTIAKKMSDKFKSDMGKT
jgi:glutathione synthase/RimK-type ligase-like ATP-grasp enzyme